MAITALHILRREEPARQIAGVMGVFAAIAGLVTLAGWAGNVQRLTDWSGSGVSMFPNTAACALLSGAAIVLSALGGKRYRFWMRAFAVLVTAIAGVTLFEHISGVGVGLDTVLFRRGWGQAAAAAPMRMGPPASTAFFLSGAALLMLTMRGWTRGGAATLGVIVSALGILSLMGYLYGARQMYMLPRLTGISMLTASVVLTLGVGILASVPEREPMRVMLEKSAAGLLARRALPALLVLSAALGWARVQVQKYNPGDSALLTAARTLVEMALLGGLLWWAVRMVRRHEQALRQSESEVRRQAMQLSTFLETAAVCLHRVGPDGTILWANDAELKTLGYAREEYVGRNIIEFHADRGVIDDMLERLTRGEKLIEREAYMKCRDGRVKTVLVDSCVLWDEGKFVHTQCFTRDITEQKRSENALRDAKEAAEAASAAKDNFMATLSHELRTPLTPALAMLSAWESSAQFPAQMRGDLRTIRRNIDLEARLIDDLLDLTRIVKGKLTLQPEFLSVHRVLDSVIAMCQEEIAAKRIVLTLRAEAAAVHVHADSGRLHQVFWNVVRNAVKFSPAGGVVEVSTSDRPDGRVCIRVSDQGIGITPETMERLFRPFEQGSDQSVRRYGGLGLGLTIARTLLEAQGGDIMGQSEGPGKGATFVITLPASAGPAAPPGAAAPPMPEWTGEVRRLRVLLVEDHADTARVLSHLLRAGGHEVEVAVSVGQAMERVSGEAFDVLISDIGLPDGSGTDLIRRIRQELGLMLPAVALSGYGMEEDVARCREAGFNEHLTKPVNLRKLEAAVQRITQGAAPVR